MEQHTKQHFPLYITIHPVPTLYPPVSCLLAVHPYGCNCLCWEEVAKPRHTMHRAHFSRGRRPTTGANKLGAEMEGLLSPASSSPTLFVPPGCSRFACPVLHQAPRPFLAPEWDTPSPPRTKFRNEEQRRRQAITLARSLTCRAMVLLPADREANRESSPQAESSAFSIIIAAHRVDPCPRHRKIDPSSCFIRGA